MSTYRMRAAALLAAGAVAGGLSATALSATADSPEDTISDTATDAGATGGLARAGHPGGPEGPGGRIGIDTAALAEALGVSEEKVSEALDEIREQLRPDAAARPSGDERPAPPTDEERAEREAAFASALAAELGLDEQAVADALDELRAAHEAERREELAERLDEAVAEGELTDADRASVLKAYDAGVLSPR
ncbi:hypothetical protein ACJ5H2_07370 [Nocardioides sp. R1-1]|uniref:hypothetical protein n=1 Tax=Nocardioides sp. R1-1 TaxID=3383502 RepID=UPI0038D15149